MQHILFLTGTIDPAEGTPLLARSKVDDRIADYREGLAFYLEVLKRGTAQHLVFVENSGYGMAPFEPMVAAAGLDDRVELMSYTAPPVRAEESRLVAEFQLMQNGLAHADTFRTCGEATVWKVTGRYRIRNIETILRRIPPGQDLYLHCRKHPKPYVDFALAGYALDKAPELIETLLTGNPHDPGYMQWVFDALDDGALKGYRVSRRMPVIPDLRGRRGKDGVSYGRLDHRAKHLLRRAITALFPRLWI